MSQIGRVIHRLREERGWSQGQLSAWTGISGAYISLIERGERAAISAELLAKLAMRFGVSVDYILEQAGIIPPLTNEDAEALRRFIALTRSDPSVLQIVRRLPDLDAGGRENVKDMVEFWLYQQARDPEEPSDTV